LATWRGAILGAGPIIGRSRILGFRVSVRFEVLDAGVPVHAIEEAWDYDLAWLQGKTLAQIRTLILDTGGPTKLLDPPAPPGTRTIPNPPPFRLRGAAVLEEWLAADGPIRLFNAVTFPLRIVVAP